MIVCVCFFRHSFSAEKSGARLNHAKGTCWPLCNRGLCENSFHHFEAGRYGPKASVEKRSNSFRGEATTAVKRQSAKKCIQPQPCVWTVICAMQLNSCFLKSCFFFSSCLMGFRLLAPSFFFGGGLRVCWAFASWPSFFFVLVYLGSLTAVRA